jgi:hypothetical protein
MSHGLGRGRGGWARQPGEGGSPQVWLQGRDDVGHSGFDSPGFRPPSARSNACKNSNFKFLKSFTLGCQHSGQGFQRYFC